MPRLFRSVDLTDIIESGESSEPVLYVGCYVLRWGKDSQPSHGFIPVNEETELGRCRAALETIGFYPALSPLDPLSALDDMRRIAREAIEPQEDE
jgi:hypothetical protein